MNDQQNNERKVKIKDKSSNKNKVRPNLEDAFKGSAIKEIISDVVEDVLEGEHFLIFGNYFLIEFFI